MYRLVGPDPDAPNRECVYIGEGDSVWTRLLNHDKDETKDFWNRVVLVISKDQNLSKSHGRYLESRVIQMAHQAGRANVMNGTAPPLPPLPEPDFADMEYSLEQVQMVFPVLSFGFLQRKPSAADTTDLIEVESPTFSLTVMGATAKACEIGGEFVVLKGSKARKEGPKSWTSYKALREQLLNDGKLADSHESEYFIFTEDVGFSSPSAGGAIVNAGNINGRISWKLEATGQTYQEWHEQKLGELSNGDGDLE
ncbi:hypothetical protein Pan97_38970 [Bremerella volcania]|uniref:DUF4357 domain-containing protein n=1 Tax=Bremerella volcania TaxID=2527984 RepID=A0A518CC95_9BACT|nr:hypothetical protein Pan97_38970 [Bremerella volcania]